MGLNIYPQLGLHSWCEGPCRFASSGRFVGKTLPHCRVRTTSWCRAM